MTDDRAVIKEPVLTISTDMWVPSWRSKFPVEDPSLQSKFPVESSSPNTSFKYRVPIKDLYRNYEQQLENCKLYNPTHRELHSFKETQMEIKSAEMGKN